MLYRVVWEIDIEADSAIDACIEASEVMLKEKCAWSFKVGDPDSDGPFATIDMEDYTNN